MDGMVTMKREACIEDQHFGSRQIALDQDYNQCEPKDMVCSCDSKGDDSGGHIDRMGNGILEHRKAGTGWLARRSSKCKMHSCPIVKTLKRAFSGEVGNKGKLRQESSHEMKEENRGCGLPCSSSDYAVVEETMEDRFILPSMCSDDTTAHDCVEMGGHGSEPDLNSGMVIESYGRSDGKQSEHNDTETMDISKHAQKDSMKKMEIVPVTKSAKSTFAPPVVTKRVHNCHMKNAYVAWKTRMMQYLKGAERRNHHQYDQCIFMRNCNK